LLLAITGGGGSWLALASMNTEMFSSLSLFDAKFTLLAWVRERKERAAKDLDSRKT
jgi:hypothetical protein